MVHYKRHSTNHYTSDIGFQLQEVVLWIVSLFLCSSQMRIHSCYNNAECLQQQFLQETFKLIISSSLAIYLDTAGKNTKHSHFHDCENKGLCQPFCVGAVANLIPHQGPSLTGVLDWISIDLSVKLWTFRYAYHRCWVFTIPITVWSLLNEVQEMQTFSILFIMWL